MILTESKMASGGDADETEYKIKVETLYEAVASCLLCNYRLVH